MHYPSFAEYSDALQHDLGLALSDALLRQGALRMRGPGHPVAHTGNFALTFEVVVDGTRHAVRCFHKPSDSLHERYGAITACLRSIRSPYFVDFEFQPSGIRTESGTYPIVRMEWAEGPTLAAFVADHRHDARTLQSLRASLRALAAHLQAHGIAHGDIQPTNLIVRGPSDLRLIDYDGMYVPQLAALASAELGQRNFQHPGRRARHFDANLDRFSFMLLDLALDAICRQPGLWEQTDSGADAFIVRAVDLADPATSPAFRLLAAVPGLEPRVTHFAASCRSPFEQVPAFEDFLAARNIPTVPIEFQGDATLSLRDRYVSVHDVVDASNFARCCTRVGDQVELVGLIVRVVMGPESPFDTDCLRVEFGPHAQDLVCLKIWPDALTGLKEIPDPTWVGRWMSAVGLLEPVHSEGSGEQRRKDVSISITAQSQLHRLTEVEARHRLRGRRETTRVTTGSVADVVTDRVVTDSVSPLVSTATGRGCAASSSRDGRHGAVGSDRYRGRITCAINRARRHGVAQTLARCDARGVARVVVGLCGTRGVDDRARRPGAADPAYRRPGACPSPYWRVRCAGPATAGKRTARAGKHRAPARIATGPGTVLPATADHGWQGGDRNGTRRCTGAHRPVEWRRDRGAARRQGVAGSSRGVSGSRRHRRLHAVQ